MSELPLFPARDLSAGCEPTRTVLRLSDGYKTAVYVHHRPGPARRLGVLYVHGIQSHPGWFVGSAAALADRGYTVFQPVRRGSGDNRIDRGDAVSAGQLLDDLETAGRFVLERTGQSRLHLLGVSWGGKLLACYARHPRRMVNAASLTLLAPGIVPRVDVSLKTKLAIAASMLVSPRRLFDIPLNDVKLFTDNKAFQDYLRRDPYRLHRATARFLLASRLLDRRLGRASDGELKLPTTLLLARRDRIIDNDATRRVVERLTARRAVVCWFDAAHTMGFEPEPEPIYQAIAESLDRAEKPL